MNTLGDFEKRIEELERLEGVIPDDLDRAVFGNAAKAALAAEALVSISQDIRSMLWRDRNAAYALAKRADESAQRIAAEHGSVINSHLPRHGSTGLDATGSYRSGGIY